MGRIVFNFNQDDLRDIALRTPSEEEHQNTRFVSQALIFSRSGGLLTLLKVRNTRSPAWDFPGGGLENGEDFLTAVDWELREELKLNPPGRYIPFSYSEEIDRDGHPTYCVMTFLTVMRDEITPTVDGVEHIRSEWQHWGSIKTPRTDRMRRFLAHDDIDRLKVDDIAAFKRRYDKNALFIQTSGTRPLHPSQPPSWEEPT